MPFSQTANMLTVGAWMSARTSALNGSGTKEFFGLRLSRISSRCGLPRP